jgi:hypothetical protein
MDRSSPRSGRSWFPLPTNRCCFRSRRPCRSSRHLRTSPPRRGLRWWRRRRSRSARPRPRPGYRSKAVGAPDSYRRCPCRLHFQSRYRSRCPMCHCRGPKRRWLHPRRRRYPTPPRRLRGRTLSPPAPPLSTLRRCGSSAVAPSDSQPRPQCWTLDDRSRDRSLETSLRPDDAATIRP